MESNHKPKESAFYKEVIETLINIGKMSFDELKDNGYATPTIKMNDPKKMNDVLNKSRRQAAQQYIESELPVSLTIKDYENLKVALKSDESFLYLRKSPHLFSSGNNEEFNAIMKILDLVIKAEPKFTSDFKPPKR